MRVDDPLSDAVVEHILERIPGLTIGVLATCSSTATSTWTRP